MTIDVLGKDLEPIGTITSYMSVLWVVRYQDVGEFAIKLPADDPAVQLLQIDNFVKLEGYRDFMCIERIDQEYTLQEGATVTVSGPSIEAIMGRLSAHGVNPLYPIAGKMDTVLKKIVETYCEGSKIGITCNTAGAGLELISINLADVGQLMYAGDHPGDGPLKITPLDVFRVCARQYGFGFATSLGTAGPIFYVYKGTDKRDKIIFSPGSGTLLSSRYTEDWSDYKNQVYVAAQGQGGPEISTSPAPTGIFIRRAVLLPRVEATGNTWRVKYRAIGEKFLAEHQPVREFTAEVAPDVLYTYGIDYKLGDICTIDDGYGHTYPVRVAEQVITEDSTGHSLHPVFEIMEE